MKHVAPVILLLLAASQAAAQDIALSQILVDGQGWKAETKNIPELVNDRQVVLAANGFRYSIDDEQ